MIKKNRKSHDELILFLFIVPSLLFVLVFYVIPFLMSLYFALVKNAASFEFVGLKNFQETMFNEAFVLATKNTVIFMLMSIPLNLIIPLGIALLVKNIRKYKNLFCVMILLPLVIASGSIAFIWKNLFSLNGYFNFLFFQNNPVDYLNTDYARLIVVVIYLWKNIGYNMILFLTGLYLIPQEYYEFASVEGASAIKRFFHVTLVYITPTFFITFIMAIINSFKSFREIYSLTGAYPHKSIYMMQHFLNNQFFNANYQKLASASYMLFSVIMLMIGVVFIWQTRVNKDL